MLQKLLYVVGLACAVGGCSGAPAIDLSIPDAGALPGAGAGGLTGNAGSGVAGSGAVGAVAGSGQSAGSGSAAGEGGAAAAAGMGGAAGNVAAAGSGGSTAGSGGSTAGSGGSTAGSGGLTGGGWGAGVNGACNSYTVTSIAAIRNPPVASGCYELSHVGLVARTDSPSEPRIYVQDKNGTDFSAILAKCAATATHACPASIKALIPQLYDTLQSGAQLSLRGYYQHGSVGGFEEFYIEDLFDEGTTVPRPAPITMSVSDLTREARVPAKWFRRATISIPAQDPLVMYDFSAPDLLLAASNACPEYAGFAMIPQSAGTSAPFGCMNATNPSARANHAQEILVGRQFFNQFLYSADCACMAGTNQIPLTPSSSVSGSVLGYLIIEQDKGSTATYQVFEPAADKTFPLQ